MFANGDGKIEDLNRNNWLGLYDLAKKRRMLAPEHRDINRFKTYKQFEDTMVANYDPDKIQPQEDLKDGAADKVFEDENVLVVVPEDEAAACKYGQGTRWCTAATRGRNYFADYDTDGPLFIIIPKKPKHPGEKYQLHPASDQYMDENDDPINLMHVFNRFPSLPNLHVLEMKLDVFYGFPDTTDDF